MLEQGSGGAYEVSQRMTAMVGWAATAEGVSLKYCVFCGYMNWYSSHLIVYVASNQLTISCLNRLLKGMHSMKKWPSASKRTIPKLSRTSCGE